MTDRDTGTSITSEIFDDPALKAAVRQTWGKEHCTGELHQRVCCLCNAGSSARRMAIWAIGAGLAAAATMAIVVGIPRLSRVRGGGAIAVDGGGAPASADAVPQTLCVDLVNTHERCVHSPNHHALDNGTVDDAAIADAMRARLSHAVLVSRPANPGWAFRGAAICHVGATPCGHLVFARGDQAVSIFSLPAAADPLLGDGCSAAAVSAGHPIVAFNRAGALFCLVGSGPPGSISTDDLQQMRQRMQSDVTADAADHSGQLAELLTPLGS